MHHVIMCEVVVDKPGVSSVPKQRGIKFTEGLKTQWPGFPYRSIIMKFSVYCRIVPVLCEGLFKLMFISHLF